jgi:hypothetical protein
MATKPWYQSKIIWLGVLMTLLGVVPLVNSLLQKGVPAPTDFVELAGGILTVILRVWFTDTAIK